MFQSSAQLKKLRQYLNVTQGDFADAIGSGRNSISMIESGRNKPTFEMITDICRVYQISADYFLSDISPADLGITINNKIAKSASENTNLIVNDNINVNHKNVGDNRQNEPVEGANMRGIIDSGVKLSQAISTDEVVFDGYFQENKLAFYLKHSDKRIDGLLSVAIDEFRDVYEAYRKLIKFSNSMGAPDFIISKFKLGEEFKDFKKHSVDTEFKEMYGIITDKKVLKCTRLIDYQDNRDHYAILLNDLINYMYRYADLYQGYLKSDPLTRNLENEPQDQSQ